MFGRVAAIARSLSFETVEKFVVSFRNGELSSTVATT